jgi:hypothetical protein
MQKPTRGALWPLHLDEIVTKLKKDIRQGVFRQYFNIRVFGNWFVTICGWPTRTIF